MKLQTLDVISESSEVKEQNNLKINTENSKFIFDAITQYSNPIGSILRELCSNAWDSHTEAGIEEPIIVSYIERKNLLEIQDFGVGMSKDLIDQVYSSLFTSTKRDSNTAIGAFGLGSKSPFGYTDIFHISTIYNNVSYKYVLEKTDNLPTISLISEEETDKHNGTTVSIPIKKEDSYKVYLECEKQLKYFKHVYYTNDLHKLNDNHVYKEYNTFFLEKTNVPAKPLICMGPVVYTLDDQILNKEIEEIENSYKELIFEKLNLFLGEFNNSSNFKITFSPRFNINEIVPKLNIGDLDVIWTRESIQYTNRTINNIKDVYSKAINEIFDFANSYIDSLDINQLLINTKDELIKVFYKIPFIDITCELYTPSFKDIDFDNNLIDNINYDEEFKKITYYKENFKNCINKLSVIPSYIKSINIFKTSSLKKFQSYYLISPSHALNNRENYEFIRLSINSLIYEKLLINLFGEPTTYKKASFYNNCYVILSKNISIRKEYKLLLKTLGLDEKTIAKYNNFNTDLFLNEVRKLVKNIYLTFYECSNPTLKKYVNYNIDEIVKYELEDKFYFLDEILKDYDDELKRIINDLKKHKKKPDRSGVLVRTFKSTYSYSGTNEYIFGTTATQIDYLSYNNNEYYYALVIPNNKEIKHQISNLMMNITNIKIFIIADKDYHLFNNGDIIGNLPITLLSNEYLKKLSEKYKQYKIADYLYNVFKPLENLIYSHVDYMYKSNIITSNDKNKLMSIIQNQIFDIVSTISGCKNRLVYTQHHKSIKSYINYSLLKFHGWSIPTEILQINDEVQALKNNLRLDNEVLYKLALYNSYEHTQFAINFFKPYIKQLPFNNINMLLKWSNQKTKKQQTND